MIAIIDYDAGNLKSVEKALQHLGEEVVITREKEILLSANKVILPGVGAFEDAMEKLERYKLIDPIKMIVKKGTPFLGICLGLQLMFERSDESEHDVPGLGILEGEILKIPPKKDLKIPHMGWNSLQIKKGSKLFQGIESNPYVYFVHSYYLKAMHEEDVAATTEYSILIHASVEHENIFGCQFHPEKSGEVGLRILKNFADL
ncbi:MAG: imidazole glycerol phosphate synthase subunit HisH [Lachnospiraceae bacterium]|nr:imidazole glycerol phosphate synthase subunit HisH [Lachnospiraceae bacterium]